MKLFFAAAGVVVGVSGVLTAQAKDPGVQPIVVRTNFVDRWITNTAEVQMQVNRFVTEYHTNWFTRVHTNVVDLFATNFVPINVTNRFLVDVLQTNFVQAYYTNTRVLNLTNWTTVVALRTNWITKPVTNEVQLDLAATPRPVERKVQQALSPNEPLLLQASRSARLAAENQVEVQLKVSWNAAPASPVHVQQWRIEREDGSVLCFGQDSEFKRVLPAGTYQVLVRAQRDGRSPLLAALGTLTVTPQEVLLQQRPARSNSSI